MPIPGSILNEVFDPTNAQQMYPSRATLRPITKSKNTANQEVHTFADSTDPTQANIQCRKSPLIQIRPQNQESEFSGNFQRQEAKFQVNFMQVFNVPSEQLIQWQVKIDGEVFQIKAYEKDGNGLTCRLMISDPLPYNA